MTPASQGRSVSTYWYLMSQARPIVIGAVAAVLLGGAVYPLIARRSATVDAQSAPPTARPLVLIARAETRPMQRTVRLTGTLKSGSEASLSPKQGGKVLGVYAQAGQAVRRGQLLVRLDTADAQRQAEQAAAGARAAQANLRKAEDGLRLKRLDVERRVTAAQRGVEQARTQVEQAQAGIRLQGRAGQADVDRAQAGVDAARSALAKARKGARPEQRRQAEIQLRQAERAVSLAKKNLDDTQFLYDKGGLPRVRLDEASEGYQKAQDGRAQAQAQLDLLNAGAETEDIAAAEAQVRTAEAALSAARAAADRSDVDRLTVSQAQSQFRQAQDGLKSAIAARSEVQVAESDVSAARAAYEQAMAASRLAAQQLEGASLTSPVDGVVTAVNTHAGEMAGPGQPLVTVVGTSGVYLEAAVPSRLLPELRPGEPAVLSVEALGGRTFRGVVRSVSTVAGPDGRSFPVRIDVSAPAGALKPGAYARAVVTVEASATALSVPVTALRTEGGKTAVWVVRDGRIAEVPVVVTVQDAARATVRGDLRSGEAVALPGAAGVAPGDAVETQSAPAVAR
jgi:RND family efflux transporter MFP subunit